ncbi:MAG: M6 family metalloprotease domain-containing protein [Gemmatimonadetes bacterium]|nr:M6 family metalloprotease domain-containing protein [Gemmatimonadota bacterium]
MHLRFRQALLLTLLSLVSGPGAAYAQDVELWGKIHGTRPPQGYYDLLEKDPGAFQFRRALIRRGLGLRELPDVKVQGGAFPGVFNKEFAQFLARAPERSPVTGTFNFPLILGLFSDSEPVLPAYQQGAVQAEFFDGPQANSSAVGTIPEFYSEISGNRVTLTGTTFDWISTPLSQIEVTAGVSGLGSGSRVGEYIFRVLESLDDGSVDWGLFDNDGPDGVPNSGDDDGYVDVLAVMHPTPGGECSSGNRDNRIWSHRWDLYWNAQWYGSAWSASVRQSVIENEGYVTQSPSAAPGVPFIRVLDYTIQPVKACSGTTINYIGVFAHELGHGFGLPDLYVTSSNQEHEGIGNWGLMGTGSWGCDGQSAWSPCHMSAWSKEVLGWADVQTLAPGTDLGTLVLPPVETSGDIYRIESGDGSSEYLLLENRQPQGFDQNLFEPGLMVWHIDPVTVDGSPGGINNDPERMGVWLRQADGRNELGEQFGGRGDAGDPFPGLLENTEFHAASNPGSWTHDGNSMGVTLLDIQQVGQDMSFRALTRYQNLTLRTQGSPSGGGLVSVDGAPPGGSDLVINSAPFQHHVLEAAPGEIVEEGIRVGFQGWTDGAPRVREHTTQLEDATFTATYGGQEFLVDVTLTSSAQGVVPGSIDFSAGDGTGWVSAGDDVTVMATPRTGFLFQEWAGAFVGLPNPAAVTVSEPVQADAVFEVIFSVAANPTVVELDGGINHNVHLTVENANPPVQWSLVSGALPPMMELLPNGSIFGAPTALGEYPVTIRVIDDIGLQGFLSLTLDVDDPEIPSDALASDFLLTGPALDPGTKVFLDNEGNRNSVYDLGDLRAYVLRNPGVGSFNQLESLLEIVVPVGDLKDSKSGTQGGGEVKR